MATTETAPTPAPAPPALPDLPPREPPSAGCLKWGLVGCGVLSALLIVSLVFAGMKARSLMEWALVKLEEQTLVSCTPEVTAAQREAFRTAFAGFVSRAKQGKVPVDEMTAFRSRLMAAVGDGKVTPEELTALTAALGETRRPEK